MNVDFEPLDPLAIDVEFEGPDTAVFLAGELDLVSGRRFRTVFRRAAEGTHGRLILDLAGVQFLDAAGLASLLDAQAAAGDRLVLRAPSRPARRLLELTGLGRRFEIQTNPGKIAYVRSLWDAYLTGGPRAMAEIVPDKVDWVPWDAGGQVLRGSREMREFWASRGESPAQAINFSQVGADVVIELQIPLPRGRHRQLWSVYHFEGDRLVQAITFGDRAAAIAFAV